MSDWELCDYEQDGGVVTIAINRPDSMNSFTKDLRADLTAALGRAGSDNTVRAVVLTGNGRAFSAGADLSAGFPTEQTIDQQLHREYRPIFQEIMSMPKPVIAAINGAAAGIGMSVALICDLAVMSEKAFMLAPFTTISLVPDGGATFLLQHHVGYKRAFQLCVETERVDAARCLEYGLVNKVVAPEAVLADAQAWAQSLCERAPLSLAATKAAMREAQLGAWDTAFNVEARLQKDLAGSDDNVEGVAAFFDKRAPVFKG
ncbi:MAG: enoyl-CoA hydratase/isomerase family protein [Woeseiaceae bacterium]